MIDITLLLKQLSSLLNLSLITVIENRISYSTQYNLTHCHLNPLIIFQTISSFHCQVYLQFFFKSALKYSVSEKSHSFRLNKPWFSTVKLSIPSSHQRSVVITVTHACLPSGGTKDTY